MKKFIITGDGTFKYGDVRMHKDLLLPTDFCYGGGFYEFDYLSYQLLLHGSSYDFGSPKWSYIDKLRLPEELHGLTVLYEDEPILLPIEYY